MKILITSGPTRQYLDPVRYLTNASSGQMGCALTVAALAAGHEVVVVSGPVDVKYPAEATVIPVVTTEEMLSAAATQFAISDGLIGVAAPCDYRPVRVEDRKIAKTGSDLILHLVETPDIVATLGSQKQPGQWVVGFALETDDHRFRAIRKLEQKSCDLIVLNSPVAMNAATTEVEVLNPRGEVVLTAEGAKLEVAKRLIRLIERLGKPLGEDR